jgi:hypothetical protein
MSVNLTYPELLETASQQLPVASLDTLKKMRDDMCSSSESRDFKLQNHQRFLRRVLSPDSSIRSLLMVHGTGTGKTCSAIQIAEEYILRPEFQDQRVLVLGNPPVQENFKNQIFDITRVFVDNEGLLLSKQCTGRRYIDMLQRIQNEPMKWTDPAVRSKMDGISKKIISEFYEFQGYLEFGFAFEKQEEYGKTHLDSWIHKNFDNRLLIIDEAHNIRDIQVVSSKHVSRALEKIIKTANNITLVLLTATPMYHSHDEILYYFNLFLWNERKQKPDESIQVSDIFDENGTLHEKSEQTFRGWCQEYVSFIRGDNPLMFPFRLPPHPSLIALPDRTTDIAGNPIRKKDQRSILTLTGSFVSGIQRQTLEKIKSNPAGISSEVICVFPENKSFQQTFSVPSDGESDYMYSPDTPTFLAPSSVSNHSSKFALIMKLIEKSEGIVLVFSNLTEYGAQVFSMCLEEHGYESAIHKRLLKNVSGEVERGSKGKYVLFAGGKISDFELKRTLQRLKSRSNADGKDIKIIVASPKLSEGVDLRFVRQIHLLDYWYNMSRNEQVIGRGIRACSHQLLPFEKQNCSVYMHVCRLPDSKKELLDEYIYRTRVEPTSVKIARVKGVIIESAMDCPLQQNVNHLPSEWKNLEIPQIRSEDGSSITLTLSQMASPIFGDESGTCVVKESEIDEKHERPFSSYTDVRDEIFDKFILLFYQKPIWTRDSLLKTEELKSYDPNIVVYMLQNAIESGLKIKNKNGTVGNLESKGNFYAFTQTNRETMQERYITPKFPKKINLKKVEKVESLIPKSTLDEFREGYKWVGDAKERFSKEVLDWFIVDHVMKEDERLEYMISLDWDNPPIYALPLIAGDIHILGSEAFYRGTEKITLVGEDADMYKKWLENRKDKFVAYNGFFGTMENGSLKLNLDDKSETLEKAERSKHIGGRMCKTYFQKTLNLFAEWLSGTPFPNSITTTLQRCQYISLLIRDAVLKKKNDILWWTPEEYSIFTENANRKELLARLK